MKLHLTTTQIAYHIQAYDQHNVTINGRVYAHNLLIMPGRLAPWPVENFECLQEQDFKSLLEWKPELILLGTGQQSRFPDMSLFAHVINQGIGIEVMNTQAACRTYSLLAAEGRQVMAALLFN